MKKPIAILFLSCALLAAGAPPAGAQTPDPAFDAANTEELQKELEILKEVMAQLKSEMAAVMDELSQEMKQSQEELRQELENLRSKTQGILSQIMKSIKEEQQAINEENQALKEELKDFKIQAKTIKQELDVALKGAKIDTKKFLEAMKSALREAREQATQTKVSSSKVLDLSRQTSQIDQQDQKRILDQSRNEVLSSLNVAIQTLEVERGRNDVKDKQIQKDAFVVMNSAGRDLKKKSAALKREVSRRQAALKANRRQSQRQRQTEAKEKSTRSQVIRKAVRKATRVAALRKKPGSRTTKRVRAAAKSRQSKPGAARFKARSKKTGRRGTEEASGLKIFGKEISGDQQKERPAAKPAAAAPEETQAEQAVPGQTERLTAEEIRLRAQLAADPLLIHKKKLAALSEQIKQLKRQLANGSKNTRSILVDIGKINLLSQRYLGALNSDDRLQLIQYADTAKIILGNFDMAVWTLKSALRLNPRDGETHLQLAHIFEEVRDGAEAVHHAKLAEHWFHKQNRRKKAAEAKTLTQSIRKAFAADRGRTAYDQSR